MIYIFHNDASENAKLPDDKSLGKMISSCAQVLVNTHWHLVITANQHDSNDELLAWGRQREMLTGFFEQLKVTKTAEPYEPDAWTQWTRTCRANYLALLQYAKACCEEWIFRNNEDTTYLLGSIEELQKERIVIMQGLTIKKHKHHDVIAWCAENVPELPEKLDCVNLPVIDTDPDFWPFVMPEKYKEHCPTCSPCLLKSYRAYYKAKLRKMATGVKCKECGGYGNMNPGGCGDSECCGSSWPCEACKGKGCITQTPKFTRREIPEWLRL